MQARRVSPQARASVTPGVGHSVVTDPFLASQITQGQQHSICQQLKVQPVLKPASVFLPSFTTLMFLPNLI